MRPQPACSCPSGWRTMSAPSPVLRSAWRVRPPASILPAHAPVRSPVRPTESQTRIRTVRGSVSRSASSRSRSASAASARLTCIAANARSLPRRGRGRRARRGSVPPLAGLVPNVLSGRPPSGCCQRLRTVSVSLSTSGGWRRSRGSSLSPRRQSQRRTAGGRKGAGCQGARSLVSVDGAFHVPPLLGARAAGHQGLAGGSWAMYR